MPYNFTATSLCCNEEHSGKEKNLMYLRRVTGNTNGEMALQTVSKNIKESSGSLLFFYNLGTSPLGMKYNGPHLKEALLELYQCYFFLAFDKKV